MMKFALRCAIADFAPTARGLGFDGIELYRSAPLLPETRELAASANVPIACITTPIRFTGEKAADRHAASELRGCMNEAKHIGCHQINFPDAAPVQQQDPLLTISALANWLSPLAEEAADRGLRLLIENSTFRTSGPLWALMERLAHASVGICWNIANSMSAGELPAITVPTLNSRIRYVRADTTMGDAMIRLMGIGYEGWVSFAGNSADAAQFLTLARPAAKA